MFVRRYEKGPLIFVYHFSHIFLFSFLNSSDDGQNRIMNHWTQKRYYSVGHIHSSCGDVNVPHVYTSEDNFRAVFYPIAYYCLYTRMTSFTHTTYGRPTTNIPHYGLHALLTFLDRGTMDPPAETYHFLDTTYDDSLNEPFGFSFAMNMKIYRPRSVDGYGLGLEIPGWAQFFGAAPFTISPITEHHCVGAGE